MKWLDAVLGRPRLPRANLDSFFTLTTALVTMQAGLDLQPTGKAGVCFKPVTSADYRSAESSILGMTQLAGKEFKSEIKLINDEYGYSWCSFEDPQFEDLVALVHLVSKTLEEEGFSEQLLSAVFGFKEQSRGRPGKIVYLIYNYKRGTFYPFAPDGDKNSRDNSLEIRISSVMEKELPVEKELNRWYPIWDCPLYAAKEKP